MISKLGTLKGQLTLIMGAIVVLLLVQGAVLWGKADTVENSSKTLKDVTFSEVRKSYELKLAIVQVQQWLTDISATRGLDGLNDGFDQAADHAANARQLLNDLEQLIPEEKILLGNFRTNFEAYYSTGQRMAKAYVDGGPESGNKLMGEFDQTAEKLQADLEAIMTHAHDHSNSALEESIWLAQAGKMWVIGSVLAVIVLVGIGGWYIGRVVIGSLERTAKLAHELANGDGDLTRRLDDTREDEIGAVSRSINQFVESIAQLVASANTVASGVSESANSLKGLASESRTQANTQLAETETVSSAMTEMKSSADEIARTVADTAEHSTQAAQQAQQGNEAVRNAASVIKSLENEIQRAQTVINQLGEDSSNIGSVLDVIRGISEQTNLLALNAAIEAARAGEQGRGFAVVADEVRTLASRTQQSTEEIQTMITTLQARAGESVKMMAESRDMAVASVSEVEQALHILESIQGGMSGIQEMTGQIAVAASQQSDVSGEMDRNVVRIAEMAHSAVSSAEQIASASGELSSMSSEISQLLQRFKTS